MISAVVNVAVNAAMGNIQDFGDFLGYAVIGAAAGAAGGAVGGAVSAALGMTSGFIAGAVSGAASGAVSTGITATGNAYMQGASLKDGFFGGLQASLVGAGVGGVTGGIAGGIKAVREGASFWDGSYKLSQSDQDYFSLLASADGVGDIPPDPGQIDWVATKSKGEKVMHMYKWIKYENQYGIGEVNLDKAFSNWSIDDTGNMAKLGFSFENVSVTISGKRMLTYLDFSVYRNVSGHYMQRSVDFSLADCCYDKVIGKELWYFAKGASNQFRIGGQASGWDQLMKYLWGRTY